MCSFSATPGGIQVKSEEIYTRAQKDVFINADADMHMCGSSPSTYSPPHPSPPPPPHSHLSDSYQYKVGSLLLNKALVLLVRLVPVAVLLLRPELL
jgi:hypothetical protein